MAHKVTIEKEKCIACGACVALCDNFKMTKDNSLAYVVNEVVEDIGMNEEAALTCPTECIHINDIKTE